MKNYLFFIVLLIVVAATGAVFWPFLTPLVLALATAVLIHPIYERMSRSLGEGVWSKRLAAFITVLVVLSLIVVPMFFLLGAIYSEIQDLYGLLTDEGSRSTIIDSLNSLSEWFSNMVFGVLPAYSFDALNVTNYLKSALEWVFGHLDAVFTSLALVAGYLVVFLLSLFYFLRDGASLFKRFINWSPVLTDNQNYISRTIERAIKSVFVGALLMSLLEGLSVGISFKVFGIPAPALWGTMAAVAALIPGFGVSVIIIPAAAYLILGGHYLFAAGLLVWGYAGIIVIDHIVGPTLVNRGIRLHPLLVLLSVLGGIIVFGITGFLIGPLVLAMLFALLDIYRFSVRN